MKIDIEKLALLARIKLTPQEKEKLQKEFEAILDYISQLKEVDISKIDEKESGKTTELENVMREDESSCLPVGGHVPEKENNYIKVKHILK
ncbi:MAG: Asp-tRNA(Asn)/Glu-tRNA(Gln) amidotransferase subunit GatC [Candidatus Daviesbacteria bacterium]